MRRGERVRSREEGKRKDKEGELRANKEREDEETWSH